MEKTQNRVASTLLQNPSCHKSCISFITKKNHSTSKRAMRLINFVNINFSFASA